LPAARKNIQPLDRLIGSAVNMSCISRTIRWTTCIGCYYNDRFWSYLFCS